MSEHAEMLALLKRCQKTLGEGCGSVVEYRRECDGVDNLLAALNKMIKEQENVLRR